MDRDTLTPETAAWFGGLLSGRGSIWNEKRGRRKYVRIAFMLSDEYLIDKLAKLWGVSYGERIGVGWGELPVYHVQKTGAGARAWLEAALPHLVGPRREEALYVLSQAE